MAYLLYLVIYLFLKFLVQSSKQNLFVFTYADSEHKFPYLNLRKKNQWYKVVTKRMGHVFSPSMFTKVAKK